MSFSRQVGSVGQMVDLFVQNATVTTGVGLPNVEISNFSAYYHRTDMTSTSTVTLVSTGTMGTWSSGQWKQINSTLMMGWYQFCMPNGMFVAGSSVSLHMAGHASMAPVVARFDIERFNNQGWVSSEPHNVTRLYSAAAVTSADGVLAVDVSSIQRDSAVTTAAGRLAVGAVGVSAFALPVGVSSITVGVSTSWFSGGTVATSEAGVLRVDVSSVMGTKAVTTVAGYFPTHFDLALTRNITSTVAFSNTTISTVMSSVSFGGSVDVTSFWSQPIVTSASGVLAVDVSSIQRGSAVTTAAGRLAVGAVGVSSITVGVSTAWFSGGTVATTAAGVLAVDVSSIRGTTAVTTVVGYFPTHFDLALTRNVDSTVTFSSVNLSTAPVLDVSTIIGQMSTANISTVRFSVSTVLTPISVGDVNVTSIWGTGLVTTAAGRIAVGAVGVSSIGVGVSTSWFSGGTVVTSAVGVLAVDVSSIQRGSAVTTAAGRLAVGAVGVSAFALPVGVSSFALPVGVSSFALPVGVSSFALSVDVSSVWGDGFVTTAAGRLAVGAVGVSSNTVGANITSVAGVAVDGTGTSSDPWGPV